METKILFNEKTLPFVLEALGNKINSDGFVVDDNNNFVLDATGKKFKSEHLIGIVGKEYITNLIQLM